ncbi:MAG: hypothetical protein ACPGO5_01850 [Patescibacteria group bacterium]
MRRYVLIAFLFSFLFQLQAQTQPKYQYELPRFLQGAVFNKPTGLATIPVLGYTMYNLQYHADRIEGESLLSPHHLYWGWASYATGYFVSRYAPDFFKKNPGFSWFTFYGGLPVFFDDGYQHHRHMNDGYHLIEMPDGSMRGNGGNLYESPVNRLYKYMLEEHHLANDMSIALFDLGIGHGFAFSAGFYKGAFVGVSWEFRDPHYDFFGFNISTKAIAGHGHQGTHMRAMSFGVAGRLYVLGPLYITGGFNTINYRTYGVKTFEPTWGIGIR